MTSYVLPIPNFIQESIATQIKRCVQHGITATQVVQAFMICKTGSCNILVHHLGTTYYMYYKLQTCTKAYKLTYLHMALLHPSILFNSVYTCSIIVIQCFITVRIALYVFKIYSGLLLGYCLPTNHVDRQYSL